MILRPQVGSKGKKGRDKKTKSRRNTLKLFAFFLLMVPSALGLAGWVLREELWLHFVMEKQLQQTYQFQLVRALGRTAIVQHEVKDFMERLTNALQQGDVTIEQLRPVKESWDQAVAAGGPTAEEAREMIDRVNVLLDR